MCMSQRFACASIICQNLWIVKNSKPCVSKLLKGTKESSLMRLEKNNQFFFFLDMLTTRPIGGVVVQCSFSLHVRFVLLESGDV